MFDEVVPSFGGDEEARGLGMGDQAGVGGDIECGQIAAEGDGRALVVAQEQVAGERVAVEFSQVVDEGGGVGAHGGEVCGEGLGGIGEDIFGELDLGGDIEGEDTAGKAGLAGEGEIGGGAAGLQAGDAAEDGVNEAGGFDGGAFLAGEGDGGIDGGIVGGAALQEQLVGAQPKERADGEVEGVEGLLKARGDDGVEQVAPAEDAGDEIEGEGTVARGEGFPAAGGGSAAGAAAVGDEGG